MKKTIAFLLIAVLACGILAACNDEGDRSRADVSETSGSGKYVADVPDRDYGGATVTFLTCGVNQTASSEILYNDYGSDDEEQMMEVVNDALRERYNQVYESIGVVIKEQYIYDGRRYNGEMINHIRNAIAGGTDTFQVCVPCLYDCATLAAEGQLIDLLGEVPYLNMSQPWWDQTFNSEMTIGGCLYFTIGDIGLINKDSTPCIAFNKDLFNEYNLESPYDLVDDGKWTLDKLIELCKNMSVDLNDDGVIDYSDKFGYGGQYDDMWYLFYGSGERIASRDADGYPYLTMYNDRSATVIDKILEFMQDDEHYVCANNYFGVVNWPAELVTQAFVEGRSLFNLSGVGTTDAYRDMEDDFGLVPIPKFNEEQENYYSMVNPWTSNAFCIPISVEGDALEMTGITLEVMGAVSKNILATAYYDVALQYQKTRDDDTVRMLEIIFNSRGCDLGTIYKWGLLDNLLHELITMPRGSFASQYDAKSAAAQSAMEETINFYKSNAK